MIATLIGAPAGSLVSGSMRVSVEAIELATHTPPAPTAIPSGPRPTGITEVFSEPASMRVTVSSPLLVTHTAPWP